VNKKKVFDKYVGFLQSSFNLKVIKQSMPTLNTSKYQIQDKYYGKNQEFGGQYVPELLLPALNELELAFEKYKNDAEFLAELKYYQQNLAGRPSPLILAKNLTKKLAGAKIFLKNEGNNFTGSHKINHCLYHALLAKRMGKTEVIAETGAGQHGFAVATVAAIFGLKAKIFMGQKSIEKQYPNVFWMQQLGAEVIPVTTGTQNLTAATDACMREWMQNPKAYFMVGSVVGPYPYPEIVRTAQKVVGREIKEQLKQQNPDKAEPDLVVACIGGGSNAIGAFDRFLENSDVRLLGVEAGGENVKKLGQHASRISSKQAKPGIFEGFKSLFLMENVGKVAETKGISAGLDYVGIGPIHAYLHSLGRLEITSASDKEVLEAFQTLAKNEGVIAALESCHAVAVGLKEAKKMKPDQVVVINLSGRADNYIFNVAGGLKDKGFKEFCGKFAKN